LKKQWKFLALCVIINFDWFICKGASDQKLCSSERGIILFLQCRVIFRGGLYMKKVQLTETVLRDAQQSLMATRLPYADYEDILDDMDKAGYYSIECWGGATFDSCLRYLNEDPWERLRNLRKHLPNTRLQMLLRGQNLL